MDKPNEYPTAKNLVQKMSCSNVRSVFYGILLPPTIEVCKGYVFTPVCQSFCSQGGLHLVGGLHPGGLHLRGACIGGVCIGGVCIQEGGLCIGGGVGKTPSTRYYGIPVADPGFPRGGGANSPGGRQHLRIMTGRDF